MHGTNINAQRFNFDILLLYSYIFFYVKTGGQLTDKCFGTHVHGGKGCRNKPSVDSAWSATSHPPHISVYITTTPTIRLHW